MLLNVVIGQILKSLQKHITEKSVRASSPLTFIDYAVTRIIFYIARYRTKCKRLEREAEHGLQVHEPVVGTSVCLFGWLVGWLCVCFEAPRSLLPRPPTPSLLQHTFNSPWCLKRCCPLQRVYNCSNLLVQIVQNTCLICLRNAGNLGCCFDQCLVYSLMSCDFPKPANSLHDIFMYLIETFRFAYSQHYRLHRKLHFTIFWLENIALLS